MAANVCKDANYIAQKEGKIKKKVMLRQLLTKSLKYV